MNSLVLITFFANLCAICFAIKCDFRYSEDDKNYPEHIIDGLVEKSSPINVKIESADEFYCEDESDKGTSIKDFIKNRFTDETPGISFLEDENLDEESLCSSTKKNIRPKAMPSISDNRLLTIINHGEFTQTVTIETCTNENKPCKFGSNFPLGYATKCKQKYQTHTIKTLNADETAIVDEKIYFPAACDCKVFSTKNIKNRF